MKKGLSELVEHEFHPGEFHSKGWGYEVWIANSGLYCGKKLVVNTGKRCSLHYHLLKDETFYIQSGKISLEYYAPNDYTLSSPKTAILLPGDCFHVPIGMAHRFKALKKAQMFEFSTQHFEEDSHRIEKGN